MVLDSKKRLRTSKIQHSRGAGETASIWQRHPEYTVLVAFGLCLFLAISLVAMPASSAQMGYEILGLQQELTRLERETARLKLEVSRMESLDRIEQVARTELGMAAPDEVRAVLINTPELYADTGAIPEPVESLTQRLTAGLVTFVARAVAGRPAQAGN